MGIFANEAGRKARNSMPAQVNGAGGSESEAAGSRASTPMSTRSDQRIAKRNRQNGISVPNSRASTPKSTSGRRTPRSVISNGVSKLNSLVSRQSTPEPHSTNTKLIPKPPTPSIHLTDSTSDFHSRDSPKIQTTLVPGASPTNPLDMAAETPAQPGNLQTPEHYQTRRSLRSERMRNQPPVDLSITTPQNQVVDTPTILKDSQDTTVDTENTAPDDYYFEYDSEMYGSFGLDGAGDSPISHDSGNRRSNRLPKPSARALESIASKKRVARTRAASKKADTPNGQSTPGSRDRRVSFRASRLYHAAASAVAGNYVPRSDAEIMAANLRDEFESKNQSVDKPAVQSADRLEDQSESPSESEPEKARPAVRKEAEIGKSTPTLIYYQLNITN